MYKYIFLTVMVFILLVPSVRAEGSKVGAYSDFNGTSMHPFYHYPESYTYDNIKEFYSKRKNLAEDLAKEREARLKRYEEKGYREFKSKNKSSAKVTTSKAAAPKTVAKTGSRGIMVDLAIASGLTVHNSMKDGATFKEALGDAKDTIKKPSFLFGQVLGGAIGASLGSMIPVPAVAGVAGSALRSLPVIGCAMLAGSLASNAMVLAKEDNLSFSTLMKSVDLPTMFAQMAGASIGAAIGQALIPIPGVGAIIGGLLGGIGVEKIMSFFRSKDDSEDSESEGSSIAEGINAGSDESAQAPSLDSKNELPDLSVADAQAKVNEAYQNYLNVSGTNEAGPALKAYSSAKKELEFILKKVTLVK